MKNQPTDIELNRLIDRHIARWNEPESDVRRPLVRPIWVIDGVQVLVNPPEGIRDLGPHHDVAFPGLEIRGHYAFDDRVRREFELFVAPGEYLFERNGEPVRQSGSAVSFNWVMRERSDHSVARSGSDVLTLDADLRIRTDHQFVA